MSPKSCRNAYKKLQRWIRHPFSCRIQSKSGYGAGGITAIVIQIENQKTAYIVIDGNNMVPGLREKILDSLTVLGFDASEVFTTDTHAVTASITGRRGYHPVGEVMDNALLIKYICEVAKKAEANLEICSVGCRSFLYHKCE